MSDKEASIEQRVNDLEDKLTVLSAELSSYRSLLDIRAIDTKEARSIFPGIAVKSDLRYVLGGANRARTRVSQSIRWMQEALEELDIVIADAENKLK